MYERNGYGSGHPLVLKQRQVVRRAEGRQPRRKGVPQGALVAFMRSFAVMVGARLPLLDALEAAAAQCRSAALRAALQRVQADVRGGLSLSEGFAAQPAVFNVLFVQLTRVGEAAGVLGDVLLRLADHLEKTAALRRKVIAALTYPAVVLCVALGATGFLLTVVVPTFAELYADFGAALPAPTQVVLRLAQAVTTHAGVVALALLLAAVAFGVWHRTPAGRMAVDRMLLRLPGLGGLLLKHAVARFCRTLATLLASGVPLVAALTLLAQAAGNRVVAAEAAGLLARVRGGGSLHRSLRQTGLFPPMVIQMVAAGERTAELDQMLLHAAAFYEQEVGAAVDGLTSLLEPVLIVLLGLLLGGLLAALYLPLFDLVNVVGLVAVMPG